MALVTLNLATSLLVILPEVSQQETLWGYFTIINNVLHQSNDTWTEMRRQEADCAVLAVSSEAEGFNMQKEDGTKASGRCQLIRKIKETDVIMADDYALYSRIAITKPTKQEDPCANNPCDGATQRYIAAPGNSRKYLDCQVPGESCVVADCAPGTVFSEAISTCIIG